MIYRSFGRPTVPSTWTTIQGGRPSKKIGRIPGKILTEPPKQRLLIRHCFVLSAEWLMRNLRDGLIFSLSPSLSPYGHIATSKRTSVQVAPFSLVYRVEKVVPIEVMVSSVRLNKYYRTYKVEVLEERRHNVKSKWLFIKNKSANPIIVRCL